MAEMRTLIARYTAQPGRGDEVAERLKEMAAAVAADEPECLLYRAARLIDTVVLGAVAAVAAVPLGI